MSPWLSNGPVEVPLFPLPKLVLFPGTLLPLHIFEPRYRDMLADALTTESRLIAIAQLRPGWEPTYEGNPPVYDTAGVGRIVKHAKNSDGTYDIMVEALARVHLDELDPGQLRYRRAKATVLRERSPKDGVPASEVSALLSLATRIASLVKRALPGFEMQAEHDDAPALLSDRLADQFVLDPAVRQDLLETLDVNLRVRALTLQLAQLHLALSSGENNSGSPTLH